jgi:hypothetical protein
MMRKETPHYNTCVGIANNEDSGYHQTLTGFWSGEVGSLVRGGRFASKLAVVRAAVASFGEDRERHRLFYGFDVVRDRRARGEWIAPDMEATRPATEGARSETDSV